MPVEFEGQYWDTTTTNTPILMNAGGTRAADNPDTDPAKVDERVAKLQASYKSAHGAAKQKLAEQLARAEELQGYLNPPSPQEQADQLIEIERYYIETMDINPETQN